MADATTATDAVLTIQPGEPVVAGIEWFTVAGATAPAGSSLLVDDPGTTLGDPVPGAQPLAHPDVAQASQYLRDALSRRDGFVAALLLAGQKGELVVYSQWRTPGPAPVNFPAAWSIAPGLKDPQRFEARTFEAHFTGPNPVTEVTPARTPKAHFGYFTVTPDNQPRMLELARQHAPASFKVPGLKAVNFHRSLDGKRVVNLGLWTGFDEFQQLQSRPGFRQGAKYWLEVAGFRPHYFDVAAVVTA